LPSAWTWSTGCLALPPSHCETLSPRHPRQGGGCAAARL
jgi:hypothetical protein